jgi:hypothetical protein
MLTEVQKKLADGGGATRVLPSAMPPPPQTGSDPSLAAHGTRQFVGRVVLLVLAFLFAFLAVVDTWRRLTAEPKEPEVIYEPEPEDVDPQ